MFVVQLLEKLYSEKAKEIYAELGGGGYIIDSVITPATQVLVTGLTPITKEDMYRAPDLKVIAHNTTGVEHIDHEYAQSVGVKIVNLQNETKNLTHIPSTAEHTFGLILALSRHYSRCFNGERVLGNEIYHKRLGIVGYGRIGKMVHKYAKAFDMITSTNPVSLEGLDYVTIHLPLDEHTVGLITKEYFKQMLSTAYFINTARPEIVKSGALQWALETGQIAGAATDFDEGFTHDNMINTPHIGGHTREGHEKSELYLANLCKKALK